ncbi:MAG: V-type ATP synthase subunit D [Oscillospiraceae bacterium]|nr:V-type ATP synthase subunit D [Oscillospiraceae bacterium]
MQKNIAPTKGNLMIAKNTLKLSQKGYEMLDKKRNILIREMMALIDEAKDVQSGIDKTFAEAYHALEIANIMMGVEGVKEHMQFVDIERNVNIRVRGVMGVEIPVVTIPDNSRELKYGIASSSSALDEAYVKFNQVKIFAARLAEIENAVYRLAMNIKKTQKRTNVLKNITIPLYTEITKQIQISLEEKEREELTRLKIIKKTKG